MRPSAAADPQDGQNPHQEPPDRQKRANQKNDRDVASPEIQTRLPSAEAFPHGQDPYRTSAVPANAELVLADFGYPPARKRFTKSSVF